MSCQEVAKEKARLADPTHRAHEAMSKAVTRLCPTCSKEYVKHDGCNKMTCTCKTKSCYLCGVKVDSYDHFCGHKKTKGQLACHCGKTCELFTSTERMEAWDRKARYKAGKKVLKETGMDKKEIRRFLKRPEKKKAPPKKKKPPPVAQQQQQVPGPPRPPPAQPANAVPREPLPGANVPDPPGPIVLEPQVPGPPRPPPAQPANAVPRQPLPGANVPDAVPRQSPIVPEPVAHENDRCHV
jgi:TRIAD3 protein (E3 ubiquitin-protein ligase RNF216)